MLRKFKVLSIALVFLAVATIGIKWSGSSLVNFIDNAYADNRF